MKLHIKKKDNKEKLAKLLASEDITVEYRKVPSASFDVEKRVLTIPILKQEISNDLHDLFIGHEVGHALYTPQNLSETLKKYCNKKDPKFPFSYLNVVEDARIEKHIRNTFPGLRYSFLQGYSELKFNNFFNLDDFGPDSHLMERINIHFKLSSLVDVSFNSEEQVFVDRIAECKTFETVLEISEDLYSFCKSKEEEEDNEEEAFQDNLPEEDGEQVDQSEEETEGNSSEESEEESEEETEGNSEEESEEESEEGNSSEGGEFFDEELETQQGFDNAFDEIISQEAKERFYVDIPKVRLDKIIVSPNIILKEMDEFDLKENQTKLRNLYQEQRVNDITKEYDIFKRKSLPIVNHMVKEFEMRKSANAYNKTRTSKTGVIDTQKLFSYKFSEDIFKQLEVNPDAKNHGLVFFMDWSGSMSNVLEDTFKQLLNLVWFCRKSNIPFKVFAFSDIHCKMNNFIDNISGVQLKYDYEDGDVRLTEGLRLFEFFNSNMNNKNFEIMAKRLFIQVHILGYGPSFLKLGGTPLNSTIAIAPEIINKFKKDNKVQIVNTIFLTDGVSHSIPNTYYDSEKNEFLGGYEHKKDMYLKKYNVLLSSYVQTSALLDVFKLKTNSNVLGFFLTNNNTFIYDLRMSESYDMDCKLKKDFRKNKYLIMKNFKGYNEFYIIKTDKNFRVDSGDEMEIDPTKTATGIKNQFMKYSKGKKERRIILSKFIEQVA